MCQKNTFFCIFLITVGTIMGCDQNTYPADEFPDIFYMDNYYECSKHEANAYCTANIQLSPSDVNSDLWKAIEEWSIPQHHFNRTVLHRTLCIPIKYKDDLEKSNFVERKTNKELKVYKLKAEVFSLDCMEEIDSGKNTKVILTGLPIYLSFILMATIYDQISDRRCRQSKIDKWLTCFSLTSSWKKMTCSKNADYQKLKCIQGIRTYQTILVISCHVCLALGQLYIKNTSYLEELFSRPLFRVLLVFFMFIIQTYFVISSWLLTNQVLEIYKKNGRFSVRDGVVLFLHRVTRFWAPLLVMIFISLKLSFINGPGNFEVANLFRRTCRKNWLATFFQVTNLLDISEVCNLGMWSLSLDTQFYFICLILLYVVLNYQLDIRKCLAFMFIFTYILNVVVFYRNDLPLLAWIHPKFVKRIDFYNEKISPMPTSYFGFWVNAGSSLVGILFGYFYFLRKETTKIEPLEKLCSTVFATVPIIAVLIGTLDTSKFVSALFGPLLKPLFGFGIASGIYGMSRNIIQGWSKSICENEYAVLLGNFTFSTYVYHFLIVFTQGAYSTTLTVINPTNHVPLFLIDILASFAVGIFCALVIEQPAINIKKIILPQIKREQPFVSEKQLNGYKDENKLN